MANNQDPSQLGSSIERDVLVQIEKRGEILNKAHKTSEELVYLYENTPWICVRPGVIYNNDDSLGRYNVLWGGGFRNVDGKAAKSGINLSKQGHNESYLYNPSSPEFLNNNPGKGRGFTPSPGVTSLSTKLQDTWGCLAEIEVKIQCWSLEDLDILSKLYFKLGHTVLIEWGHSMVLRNDGTIQQQVLSENQGIIPNGVWFGNTTWNGDTVGKNLTKVNNLIAARRKAMSGNYEGFCGYVTNFSWSFNKNGYDCTLKVRAPGSVIFQSNIPLMPGEIAQDSGSIKQESVSFLEGVMDSLERYTLLSSETGPWKINDPDLEDKTQRLSATINRVDECRLGTSKEASHIGFNGNLALSETQKVILKDPFYTIQIVKSAKKHTYVRVSDFLWMLNQFCKFSDNYGFNLQSYHKFATFKGMVSLDPYNVLLANPDEPCLPSATIGTGKLLTEAWPDRDYKNWFYVENILISTTFVKEVLKQATDLNTINLQALVNALCSRLTEALGSINNFSYQVVDGLISIVDRNYISSGDPSESSSPRVVLSGLKSTIKTLSCGTEITPETSNMLSIAAGGNKDYLETISPFLERLSKNCQDRLFPVNTSVSTGKGTISEAEEIEKRREELEKAILFVVSMYLDLAGTSVKAVNTEGVSLVPVNSLYQDIVNRERENSDTRQTNIIPIKVMFTMMGIARFIVGSSFRVESGLIPTEYNGWGYIITGVTHTVNKSGWNTEIKTQYYPVD